MPYSVTKSGSGYKVRNKENGKEYSKKPMAKEKAKKQMAAIYANTQEESFSHKIDKLLEEYDYTPRKLGSEVQDNNSSDPVDPYGKTREMPTSNNVKNNVKNKLKGRDRAIRFLSLLYKYTHIKYTFDDLKRHGAAQLIKAAVNDMAFTRFLKDNPRLLRREIIPKVPDAERLQIFYSWIKSELDG